MPDLGPQSPSATYGYILQVDGGLDSSLQEVEDGDGTDAGFWLSTISALFENPVRFKSGTGETAIARENEGGDPDTNLYTIFLPQLVPSSSGKVMLSKQVGADTVSLQWQGHNHLLVTEAFTAGSAPDTYNLTATSAPHQRVESIGTGFGALIVGLPNPALVEEFRYFRIKNVGSTFEFRITPDATPFNIVAGDSIEVVAIGGTWVVV